MEAALEEKVRPALRAHGGDIAIDRLEGKTLYVKMLGQCAGMPLGGPYQRDRCGGGADGRPAGGSGKGGGGADRQR